jgi:hypothetical protein
VLNAGREAPTIVRTKSLSSVLFATASFGSIHGTRSNPRAAPPGAGLPPRAPARDAVSAPGARGAW